MNTTIIEISKKLVAYVEENKHMSSKITVNGLSYNYGSYAEILASTILNKDTLPTKTKYDNAPSPKGEKINKKYNKTEYISMAKMTVTLPTNCEISYDMSVSSVSSGSERRVFLLPKSQFSTGTSQPSYALFS